MGSKLYVGNLPYAVRDQDLQQAFMQYGTVVSAKVMMERDTGRSKGFGFVEMGGEAEAQAAIEGMNGQPLGGRSLVVNIARPMEPRPPRPSPYGEGFQRRNDSGFRSPYGANMRSRQNGYGPRSSPADEGGADGHG